MIFIDIATSDTIRPWDHEKLIQDNITERCEADFWRLTDDSAIADNNNIASSSRSSIISSSSIGAAASSSSTSTSAIDDYQDTRDFFSPTDDTLPSPADELSTILQEIDMLEVPSWNFEKKQFSEMRSPFQPKRQLGPVLQDTNLTMDSKEVDYFGLFYTMAFLQQVSS